jgi:hypothetical protein
MKYIFVLVVSMIYGMTCFAQITIDQTDMPNAGDTLRVSVSTVIPGDYTKSGMDTTWDFTGLFSMNQQLDSFVSKQNTPLVLQFLFANANLASPGGVPSFPGLPVSSPFTFFQKAAGFYDDLGFAFIINVGAFAIPSPAKYDTADRIYAFPLTTGSNWSSHSSVSLSFPGLASYYQSLTRTNTVDGWGTLKTPWGDFETIRVKSHIIEKDSLYLDTLGMGVPVIRDITQYKWLAKGKGIPVLQINQEGPLATAIYRDFYRQPFRPVTVDLGPDTAVLKGSVITITANAAGGTPPYMYIWSDLSLTPSITVTVDTTTRYSVAVLDANNNAGFGTRLVSIKPGPGINEKNYRPLNIYPNPTEGRCKLQLSKLEHPEMLQILTAQGEKRKEIKIPSTSETVQIDITGLPPGLYILQLLSGQTCYRGKLILQPGKN